MDHQIFGKSAARESSCSRVWGVDQQALLLCLLSVLCLRPGRITELLFHSASRCQRQAGWPDPLHVAPSGRVSASYWALHHAFVSNVSSLYASLDFLLHRRATSRVQRPHQLPQQVHDW